MNPQQIIVALAGLGLVVFRYVTSQQRQALAALWNGQADGRGNWHLTGPPNGEGPGNLLPPGTLGGQPPATQTPNSGLPGLLIPPALGGPTQGTGPGGLLPPGTLSPPASGPASSGSLLLPPSLR